MREERYHLRFGFDALQVPSYMNEELTTLTKGRGKDIFLTRLQAFEGKGGAA